MVGARPKPRPRNAPAARPEEDTATEDGRRGVVEKKGPPRHGEEEEDNYLGHTIDMFLKDSLKGS